MTDKLFKCKCGCTQFISIVPHQYQAEDVNKWGSFGQRIYGITPVLICLNCNHITVPPISMSGKNILDPNVKAFGDLLKWVEEHNKPKPEHVCKCAVVNEEVGKPYFNHPREEDEEMGKLDKQTIPTKVEVAGPSKQGSMEPRNKTTSKPKRVAKPKTTKTKSRTSKDTTDV